MRLTTRHSLHAICIALHDYDWDRGVSVNKRVMLDIESRLFLKANSGERLGSPWYTGNKNNRMIDPD